MIHAYFTKPLYLKALLHEIKAPQVIDEQMVLVPELGKPPAFAVDIWPDCETISFHSINDAIKQLKSHALRWAYYGSRHFRRGALIADGLKKIKNQAIEFHQSPGKSFAIFTMLNENEILLCRQPWKKIPCGEISFVENKRVPPNRAYLKLWEALTIMEAYPKAGEYCLDLGASPGGWSWVLAESGANVLAIDKAPLAPHLMQTYPNIRFQEGSAFALDPQDFDPIDWLCSDIICYPERALSLIEKWVASGKVKHLICTIKLQGEIDWKILQALQNIEKGRLTHLFNNKHELTFLYKNESFT